MNRYLFLLFAMLLAPLDAMALDSYRFLHVTIETPWLIFMGLLVVIMFPFVLTAVLHWYFAIKKRQQEGVEDAQTDQ